jgi:short-subunit dehydrogenase
VGKEDLRLGSLTGLRALVTGATSGIGQATAEMFAREGCEVAVLAESEDAVMETVLAIQSSGGKAIPVVVDLSRHEEVVGVIDRLEENGFPLDILVNNAGIGMQADILEARDGDYRLLFQINFFAMATLSRDALRYMARRGRGSIINVGSAAGRRALPGMSTYACTKAAMHVFSQALRVEAKGFGVEVTELLPMSVRTPFFANAHNRSQGAYEVGGFCTTPEKVAQKIVKAVHRPAPEVYTSTLSRIALALTGINPRWFDAILIRMRRKSRREQKVATSEAQ